MTNPGGTVIDGKLTPPGVPHEKTLRDEIALKFLDILLPFIGTALNSSPAGANIKDRINDIVGRHSARAYLMADAMLAERNKPMANKGGM